MLAVATSLIENKQGYYVPAAISGRHVHLCRADIDTLFGTGYKLSHHRDLVQPGQFACKEKVALVGAKGRIEGVRVLGPARPHTQVEISQTDSYKAGIVPVVRMSGKTEGTPGCTLMGPKGEVKLDHGVIIAARHLHMSAAQADRYGLMNGQVISVRKTGVRETIFGNVVVRAGDGHELELHIDTDEANAAGMTCGELLEIVVYVKMMESNKELIERITKEVLSRLGINQYGEKKPDTLAVYTGYVFNEAAVSAYLNKRENVTCVLFGEAVYNNAAFDYINAAAHDEKQRLANMLDKYNAIVIVTPPLSYIQRAAAADDSAYECMLALRPLLWGKKVTLLLDFALPRNKRGFSELSDSIDALEQMGMVIEALRDNANEGRKELVTEQDVKDAAKRRLDSIKIMPNAIVTALARDTAAELGIRIEL